LTDKKHICPVWLAGFLDNWFRKWLQNPRMILGPYIKSGMTVLDFGCGPGFFTVEIAKMVGTSGKVIAVDVQEEMLKKLKDKIIGTDFNNRILLHKSFENRIGIVDHADVVVAFYVFHELTNKIDILYEIKSLLKKDGIFIMIEPKYVHVSKKDFNDTVSKANNIGLKEIGSINMLLSRSVVMKN
jgi:ubiquinone/menaquinone biosynthesis C-methylase UbiE